jgi:trk system potassium uptake protein TrkH
VSRSAGAFRTLHFAVRARVLARYLGQLLLVLAAFTVVPACVSLLSGRADIALRYASVIALLAGLGAAGARLQCTERLQANEALVISALVFLIPGVVLAWPLMGYGIAPLDAVFEAISGVTTTGLSTLGSVEDRPRSFLFARAWMQWVGGFGVVVLALAFMIPSGVAAKRLGFDDREAADYVGGARGHARRVLLVYVCLTAGGIALCAAAGLGAFDALTHALAAISTGGFATADSSLAGVSAGGQAAVAVVCLAGAVSFSLYYRLSPSAALHDTGLWVLLGLTALATVGVATSLVLAGAGSALDARTWGDAASMAVSAQSTAGFSTLSTAELPPLGKATLVLAMIVGGEAGSTAGGLKVLRLVILAQLVLARVLRSSMPPSSQLAQRLDGARVGRPELEAAAALALAYAGVVGASWLVFVAYGHDPLDALFEVCSALSTVGLSAGPTGPDLEPALKAVLCVDMLMGRVELFAFFVLVFPGTWIGRRRSWQE